MPWIPTITGRKFDLLNPTPDMIHPADIFKALSQLCRFTGQTSELYTVAQHSMHVADLVPKRFEDLALMHDATEAYIGDISSPLKAAIGPRIEEIEHRIAEVIAIRFGLDWSADGLAAVKHADMVALSTERRDLLCPGGPIWSHNNELPDPDPMPIRVLTPGAALDKMSLRAAAVVRGL